MTYTEIIKALGKDMDLIDLIERQQAEIERLKSMNQSKRDIIHDIRADLETAKAESVKEFAEEVKMQFYREFDEIIPSIMADAIDNLVKEFTEGKNDECHKKKHKNGRIE